jgi:hypothetical protein
MGSIIEQGVARIAHRHQMEDRFARPHPRALSH